MNTEEHIVNEDKLRLLESMHSSVWVRWRDGKIELTTNSPDFKNLSDSLLSIEKLVRESDIKAVTDHLESASSEISTISFDSCSIGGKSYHVECATRLTENVTYSLWKFNEESNGQLRILENAVHDLRAPLNAITGMVIIGQQLIGDEEMDRIEMGRLLDMINSSSQRALTLTTDILQLSELESTGYVLKTNRVVMKDFLSQYVNTHRLLTYRKQISIVLSLETDVEVAINEMMLTRVLDNLVTNAVKFSKAGSSLHLGVHESSKTVKVKIRDEGIGIPPEMINSLFVKFGKSRRKGLEGELSHGLGMSIVKQIMDLHQAEVLVESEEGNGTEITLVFKKA